MPTRTKLLYFWVLLIAWASAIDAHAGATISDRRYWPSEARGSPGQSIGIYPHPYVYPQVGVAAGPRIVPRQKTRRNR